MDTGARDGMVAILNSLAQWQNRRIRRQRIKRNNIISTLLEIHMKSVSDFAIRQFCWLWFRIVVQDSNSLLQILILIRMSLLLISYYSARARIWNHYILLRISCVIWHEDRARSRFRFNSSPFEQNRWKQQLFIFCRHSRLLFHK